MIVIARAANQLSSCPELVLDSRQCPVDRLSYNADQFNICFGTTERDASHQRIDINYVPRGSVGGTDHPRAVNGMNDEKRKDALDHP